MADFKEPTVFTGQLRPNHIYASLFNMLIGQRVFADNIADTQSELVNLSKKDGTLYGDTMEFVATDILGSYPLINPETGLIDNNVLERKRPVRPDLQSVTIDNYRQIALTVDDYLSKQAWMDEGAFGKFMSVMEGWIGETKRVYEAKLFNTFVGTQDSSVGKQSVTITLPTNEDPEKENRLQAQAIATKLADLYIDLADASRFYNDNANYRGFSKGDMIVVWNADYVNKILKTDLPTIYHKDALFDSFKYKLPSHFFGKRNETPGATGPANATVYSLVEKDFNDVAPDHEDYVKSLHIFPGDLWPSSKAYQAGETYTVDDTIVFKMYHRESIPFLSNFEVATSFFNAKSLEENRYLTWGYSDLTYLTNYPFITAKAVEG